MEPLLLKAGEVAKLLGLGRSKVFAMLAVRELPVIRIGRSVRVPRAALEDWIAEQTQHASGRSGDGGPLFVGMDDRDGFTRRHAIPGRSLWTTSAWVIDEKAYALGKGKKLVLLREDGIDSIGGIQGDYEFVEFKRAANFRI